MTADRFDSTLAPVGIFDSGVGGLSVLREIRRELPAEDLVYIADSANAPYGDRTDEFIRQRAFALTDALVSRGAKALVVACNTASEVAIEALRGRYALPIVAMEPAVKPAVSKTRSGIVGVLATSRTLASPRYEALVKTHAGSIRVLSRACPRLVERVEAGDLESDETRGSVADHVEPLVAEGADVIVLGCTHFPFLRRLIQETAGPGVDVLDPAVAVTRQLWRRLDDAGLRASDVRHGRLEVWTTGGRKLVEPVVRQLLDEAVPVGEISVPSA